MKASVNIMIDAFSFVLFFQITLYFWGSMVKLSEIMKNKI